MIQVFGSPASGGTRKVLAALLETNTPHELKVIDFAKREHKQEPFLARQPFGQVPAIDDDGFVLFESRAIVRYVSAKAGDKLTPSTLRDRALMDQWLSVEQANFSPYVMKFVYHHVFNRPQDEAVLQSAEVEIDKALVILSKALGNRTFLVGETFTLADLCYMPYFEYMQPTPLKEKLALYPNIAAWWGRLRERDSWRKVTGRG